MIHLKMISPTVGKITRDRQQVGSVVKKHDGSGWYGHLTTGANRVEHTGHSSSEVFHELVRQANRISLCGVNDADKARKALDKRNAETLRRNDELNKLDAPFVNGIIETMEKINPEFGAKLRHGMATRKPRYTKILL